MPPNNASTLQKLVFQNVEQFMEDLNGQFAVIQNSPLFKGIPGKSIIGPQGPDGIRGARFLFVQQTIDKFITDFPLITKIEDVTIEFLNLVIQDFDKTQKLCNIFTIDNLVDGDIIVLGNTLMIIYDKETNLFTSTNVYFNEETNLRQNLKQIVAKLIEEAFAKLKRNIFTEFPTLGKNYSDNNSMNVSDELTSITAYSPYIEKFNSNSGLKINNHKYYSFTEMVDDQMDTTLLGNLKDYYRMLHVSVKNAIEQSFNSQYVPGVGNVPKIIMMQNDTNSGFYFGYGGDKNLFNFASLFKDADGRVVLKSHSSPLKNEYSYFAMDVGELYYNKNIRIDGEFLGPIARIDKIFGHTNFFTGSLSANLKSENIEDWTLAVLRNNILLNATNIRLRNFKHASKKLVLTTNNLGYLEKRYFIAEGGGIDSMGPNDIITGEQLDVVHEKLKQWIRNLTQNYYTKSDWANNGVGTIKTHDNNFIVDNTKMLVNKDIYFPKLKNADYITTDANGKLIKKYKHYKSTFTVGKDANDNLTFTYGALNEYDLANTVTPLSLFKKLTDGLAGMISDAIPDPPPPTTYTANRMLSTKANGSIEAVYLLPQEYKRKNTSTNLSDYEYAEKFFEDSSAYDYLNIPNDAILSGREGNFFMMLFRSLKTSKASEAFDREARFIVGRKITDGDLQGSDWWVADGTNNTDDMRGRQVIGGGGRYFHSRTFGLRPVPYFDSGRTGQAKGYYIGNAYGHWKITADELPPHKHQVRAPRGENGNRGNSHYEYASGTSGGYAVYDTQSAYGNSDGSWEHIRTMDPCITGTWIQYVKADKQPPTAPRLTSAVATGPTTARLAWTASTDDVQVAGYRVYINGSYGGWSSNGQTLARTIDGLTASTTYSIQVAAYDASGKVSPLSNAISITTQAPDTQNPTPPASITASFSGNQWTPSTHQYSVSWSAATDNVAVVGYRLETKLTTESSWVTRFFNASARSTTISGSSDTTGATRQFRVYAVDEAGNLSDFTNTNVTKSFSSDGPHEPICESEANYGEPAIACCFTENTPLKIAAGHDVLVQNIKIGDKLYGDIYGAGNEVHKIIVATNPEICSINNSDYFITSNHPMMTTEGLKAFNPELAMIKHKNLGEIKQLEIGDKLIKSNGVEETINNFDIKQVYNNTVYSILVDGDKLVYANDYLVYNS